MFKMDQNLSLPPYRVTPFSAIHVHLLYHHVSTIVFLNLPPPPPAPDQCLTNATILATQLFFHNSPPNQILLITALRPKGWLTNQGRHSSPRGPKFNKKSPMIRMIVCSSHSCCTCMCELCGFASDRKPFVELPNYFQSVSILQQFHISIRYEIGRIILRKPKVFSPRKYEIYVPCSLCEFFMTISKTWVENWR